MRAVVYGAIKFMLMPLTADSSLVTYNIAAMKLKDVSWDMMLMLVSFTATTLNSDASCVEYQSSGPLTVMDNPGAFVVVKVYGIADVTAASTQVSQAQVTPLKSVFPGGVLISSISFIPNYIPPTVTGKSSFLSYACVPCFLGCTFIFADLHESYS